VLLEHVWGQRLSGPSLTEAVRHVFDESSRLRWSSVLGPFARYAILRERKAELRTIVTRLANLVAKADGTIQPSEQARLTSIEVELDAILEAVPLAVGASGDVDGSAEPSGLGHLQTAAAEVRQRYELESTPKPTVPSAASGELLADALLELDRLVGLAPIKQEIHTLVNFLKVQAERRRAGLPTDHISLHMVFRGNPGTGKTTVARLVGRILGALGILKKGHLVETDRSGLVASYSGQTGPRTHKKIDEALDGVLFIDEAYSLILQDSEDAFGADAVQTLLKRMEDDRQRLVVILAGYPAPMDRLLKSNPGLSSRFNRQLSFPDYSTVELGQLFQQMCEQSQYTMTSACRVKLAQGFFWLRAHRDEQFGNGRLVRNTFESATRRLANRIVGIAPLTHELLTQFEADDIELQGAPFSRDPKLTSAAARFAVACPGCGHASRIRGEYLGRRVQCRKCGQEFRAEWGEPLESL
jgi:ATPase family associated with various cellular activities (AAA)/AAA lid domain